MSIDINNPLKGKMNGYEFSVRAKSMLARKVDKELKQDMKDWHKENNKEFIDFMDKYSKELANQKFDELPEDIPENNEWLDDEEFRAERFKKMADACMVFKKQPPKEIWGSDEIEYGMIEMAFDYFLGKREVPKDMLIR